MLPNATCHRMELLSTTPGTIEGKPVVLLTFRSADMPDPRPLTIAVTAAQGRRLVLDLDYVFKQDEALRASPHDVVFSPIPPPEEEPKKPRKKK